jgi:very-short-patch-repair endonuclease
MDVRAAGLLRKQEGVVGRWQLLGLGWSPGAVRHFAGGVRQVHPGVYLTGHAPISQTQRWWAAALTRPGSVLSGVTAAAAWEIRPWAGPFEVVTRPGSGGPSRVGGLLVCRSRTILENATSLNGLPITTPERTIADLAAQLDAVACAKLVREAARRHRTTMRRLAAHLARHPGRRGTASLRVYVARHTRLPFHRCRSDAEARALEVLDAARIEIPAVNVRIAGEEADLSWAALRLIVEIDGPNFHRFADEDARKTAVWRQAGWEVRRIPSGLVFDEPRVLLALATAPTSDRGR